MTDVNELQKRLEGLKRDYRGARSMIEITLRANFYGKSTYSRQKLSFGFVCSVFSVSIAARIAIGFFADYLV
jgi:hypothetical protein